VVGLLYGKQKKREPDREKEGKKREKGCGTHVDYPAIEKSKLNRCARGVNRVCHKFLEKIDDI